MAHRAQFRGEEVIDAGEHPSGITNDELATKLMTGIDQNVGMGKEQVFIAITEEGIRIQIVDSKENPIFPVGSAELTDSAKQIVRSIASILKNFPNEIAVEGHTDSSPTRSEQVSNWNSRSEGPHRRGANWKMEASNRAGSAELWVLPTECLFLPLRRTTRGIAGSAFFLTKTEN